MNNEDKAILFAALSTIISLLVSDHTAEFKQQQGQIIAENIQKHAEFYYKKLDTK